MTDAAPIRWIDSTSWELEFFGLPSRIPWPANVDPKLANSDPFEMNYLLDAIEAMGPDAPEPWGRFLQASEHLDEFGEAVQNSEIVRAYEFIERFDELFPDTGFALYHRGSLARLEGDDEGAVELFQQAAEKAPRGVAIWNSIGVVQATRGEKDAAVEAFKKALAVSPQDRTALDGLVQLRQLVKMLRNARDPNSAFYMDLPTFNQMALRQVQQLINEPEQLLNYGEQLLREGYAPEAGLAAMQRACTMMPGDPRPVFGLTNAYRAQNKLEEARATIGQYADQHPEDPRGFFYLAQVCNGLGETDAEMKALDRVIELDCNVQPALALRFGLTNDEHDPAREAEMARFGEARNSFMAYILASGIARKRGDVKPAVKWAEKAYELAPDVEDVLLHYTATLGEARDFEKLVRIVKPIVESGKFSKRLNWNYAQVLQQTGLTDDAVRVLREAATAGDVPDDFKAAVKQTVEAWTQELTGCGVPLEVHQAGFLQRPVLLVIDDEEGGVVLPAGAKVPATTSFPWKASGPETRIQLQQGESGGSLEVQPLGAFIVRDIEPGGPIECHVVAREDGAFLFRAVQGNRKLKVGWMPLGLDKSK
jgi:tetratricopeptide (TPR) repeat protein